MMRCNYCKQRVSSECVFFIHDHKHIKEFIIIALNTNYFTEKKDKKNFLQKTLVTFDLGQKTQL